MFSQNQEVKLEWMYKGSHSTVDREEYLLGRSVDKTLEQINTEEKQQVTIVQPKNHVEHECIPPSIREYKLQCGEQVDISTKLQEDPLIAIKKQEEDKRRQFLNNPVQLKKLQKALKAQRKQKNQQAGSDKNLETKLIAKLRSLKHGKLAAPKLKKLKGANLDTILMHKYNQLKSKLSDNDLRNIFEGCTESSSSSSDSDSSSTEEEDVKKITTKNKGIEDKKYEAYTRPVAQRRSGSVSKERKNSTRNALQKKHIDEKSKRRDRSRSYDRDRNKRRSHEPYVNKEQKSKHRRNRSRSFDDSKNKEQLSKRSRSRSHDKFANKELKSKHKNQNRSYDRDDYKPKRTRSRSHDKYGNKEEKLKHKHVSKSRNDKPSQNKNKSRKRKSSSESTESSSSSESTESSSSSDSERHKKKNWGLIKADGTKIPVSAPKPYIKPQIKPTQTSLSTNSRKQKLTEEEKEKRRQEMLVNASWRETERSKNLENHRKKMSKEDEERNAYNPEFLQKELLKSANSASVESRIKSNINNIQRSGNDMNKHFSRR